MVRLKMTVRIRLAAVGLLEWLPSSHYSGGWAGCLPALVTWLWSVVCLPRASGFQLVVSVCLFFPFVCRCLYFLYVHSSCAFWTGSCGAQFLFERTLNSWDQVRLRSGRADQTCSLIDPPSSSFFLSFLEANCSCISFLLAATAAGKTIFTAIAAVLTDLTSAAAAAAATTARCLSGHVGQSRRASTATIRSPWRDRRRVPGARAFTGPFG